MPGGSLLPRANERVWVLVRHFNFSSAADSNSPAVVSNAFAIARNVSMVTECLQLSARQSVVREIPFSSAN
jgi:hypothetical protein